MEELSLWEKFGVFYDNILKHPLFIILLLVPAIIFLLQKKHGKKVFVIVYLLVIIFVLYIGGEVIFELFDNLMNGLFMTLYFPNFITLFVVVVLCSIIALVSFFRKKMYRINKIINITGFAIVQMLFVLTLTVIRSNDIDIYADNALYSNSDVLTLMQLLIGTFALQIISICIINAINKVTDILDKRSTPLAHNIEKQITSLEQTKNSSLNLIHSIEIDNTKVGYINVADKSSTSKPKLKPFHFDVDKLESITLNIPEEPTYEQIFGSKAPSNQNEILFTHETKEPTIPKVEKIEEKPTLETSSEKSPLKNKISSFGDKLKPVMKKRKKQKQVLLPKEKEKPISFETTKPNLLEPIDIIGTTFEKSESLKKDITKEAGQKTTKFISNIKSAPEKPNLLESSPLTVVSEVDSPKLIRTPKSEPKALIENLKIIDIQSTLDTVIRYHLMKGVNLKLVPNNENVSVDKLQIPDFDQMTKVLVKCQLYKNYNK